MTGVGVVRPWLGFVMVTEYAMARRRRCGIEGSVYPTDPTFDRTSYTDRYGIRSQRLVRERLYDATCLISTERGKGIHHDPLPEVSTRNLTAAIAGRVAYIRELGLEPVASSAQPASSTLNTNDPPHLTCGGSFVDPVGRPLVRPAGRCSARVSASSPYWAAFLRSSRQWISWVSGCRHSLIRYSNPGSSTIGIGSGEAGATAPTTILASTGMNGDCAGTGPVRISTGSP